MSTLVLFDIAEEQPRKRAREVLARLGFARVCPNVYERHHATPTPREVARAVAGVLRGAVFLLRVYGLAARTQIVLRYGGGRGARRAAAKPNNAARPGTATDGAPGGETGNGALGNGDPDPGPSRVVGPGGATARRCQGSR